jgi:hypothetical protein
VKAAFGGWTALMVKAWIDAQLRLLVSAELR